jgi:hypothetical protein
LDYSYLIAYLTINDEIFKALAEGLAVLSMLEKLHLPGSCDRVPLVLLVLI